MHQFFSRAAVIRFKLASWLLVLLWLLVPATLGLLIYTLLLDESKFKDLLLGLNIATVAAVIIHWPLSAHVRCPICLGQAISQGSGSRNRKAKPLFGSYGLRVACSAILRRYFCCPCCGETTELKVRSRGSQQKSRRRR
ncbi:MAG: hypothetical protein RLZZ214_2245 [Verrucomicrobiota bacterium]|jgi:hypothetical protein